MKHSTAQSQRLNRPIRRTLPAFRLRPGFGIPRWEPRRACPRTRRPSRTGWTDSGSRCSQRQGLVGHRRSQRDSGRCSRTSLSRTRPRSCFRLLEPAADRDHQESPRDRLRAHRARRSRAPHPHKPSRRARTARRDLAAARRLSQPRAPSPDTLPWTWAEHRAGRRGLSPSEARERERSDLDSPAAGATIIHVQGGRPLQLQLGSPTTQPHHKHAPRQRKHRASEIGRFGRTRLQRPASTPPFTRHSHVNDANFYCWRDVYTKG